MINIGNTNISDLYIANTEVRRAYLGTEIVYEKKIKALKFTALEDHSSLGLASKFTKAELEYSMDGIDWSGLTTSTTIDLDTDEFVYVRGTSNEKYPWPNYYNCTNFSMTGKFSVKGNLNHVLNYTYASGRNSMYNNCAYRLFYNCGSLVDAGDLILPSKSALDYCYYQMFCDCTGLTSAPELPATDLRQYCYKNMFSGCMGLTSAPELPATELSQQYVYSGMFSNCTGLTTAPELPATKIRNSCYSYMFSGCKSLTSAPDLPATEVMHACYQGMFDGCVNLLNAPNLPATILSGASYCYSVMFSGCEKLKTPPALPATELGDSCYYGMFSGCTALESAPSLPATATTYRCYTYMFALCSGITTAPELPAPVLSEESYRGMFIGCTSLSSVTCLATDITASNCTRDWLSNVSPNGIFKKDPTMTSWTTGQNGIPQNWSVVDNT